MSELYNYLNAKVYSFSFSKIVVETILKSEIKIEVLFKPALIPA